MSCQRVWVIDELLVFEVFYFFKRSNFLEFWFHITQINKSYRGDFWTVLRSVTITKKTSFYQLVFASCVFFLRQISWTHFLHVFNLRNKKCSKFGRFLYVLIKWNICAPKLSNMCFTQFLCFIFFAFGTCPFL